MLLSSHILKLSKLVIFVYIIYLNIYVYTFKILILKVHNIPHHDSGPDNLKRETH